MKITFRLGSMSPWQSAETALDNILRHVRTLRDDAGPALGASVKVKQFHQGEEAMANTLIRFLENVVVED